MNIDLQTCTDAELDAIEASAPKQGKPEVYAPKLVEILTEVGDKQGTFSLHWNEINANAKPGKTPDKNGNVRSERDNVLANLRRVSGDNATAKARLTFLRNTDDERITVIVRKAPAAPAK
jgi:hypothetical protein